jgi:hypothetical protein
MNDDTLVNAIFQLTQEIRLLRHEIRPELARLAQNETAQMQAKQMEGAAADLLKSLQKPKPNTRSVHNAERRSSTSRKTGS